jgi:hypothetical protein
MGRHVEGIRVDKARLGETRKGQWREYAAMKIIVGVARK